MPNINQTDINKALKNIVGTLPENSLEEKLKSGKTLNFKLGVDPTAPDIHFGHCVVFTKIREFQDLGHKLTLIIGDFTTKVGDPTGRSSARPILSDEQIKENALTYMEQAFKVLDKEKTEVVFNSQWLDMNMNEMFNLLRNTTVAQLLERDDFKKRFENKQAISVLELLYPIMQGFDSVNIKSDVEIGGTDQTFNMLLGRDLQKAFDQGQQTVVSMPILTGLDGVKKMSKSLKNYIGVNDEPDQMFGKVLSIGDDKTQEWFNLLLNKEPDNNLSARDQKHQLALELVEKFHNKESAIKASKDFEAKFVKKEINANDLETIEITNEKIHLPALIAQINDISNSQARRLLKQNAIKLDDKAITELDIDANILNDKVLKTGKHIFRKIIIKD